MSIVRAEIPHLQAATVVKCAQSSSVRDLKVSLVAKVRAKHKDKSIDSLQIYKSETDAEPLAEDSVLWNAFPDKPKDLTVFLLLPKSERSKITPVTPKQLPVTISITSYEEEDLDDLTKKAAITYAIEFSSGGFDHRYASHPSCSHPRMRAACNVHHIRAPHATGVNGASSRSGLLIRSGARTTQLSRTSASSPTSGTTSWGRMRLSCTRGSRT